MEREVREGTFKNSFIFNNTLVVNINIYATNFPLPLPLPSKIQIIEINVFKNFLVRLRAP